MNHLKNPSKAYALWEELPVRNTPRSADAEHDEIRIERTDFVQAHLPTWRCGRVMMSAFVRHHMGIIPHFSMADMQQLEAERKQLESRKKQLESAERVIVEREKAVLQQQKVEMDREMANLRKESDQLTRDINKRV